MPLSRLEDDLLEGLGAAFSRLSVGTSEGKEKEKEAVDIGAQEEDSGFNTIHPIRYPWMTYLLRAHQAPLNTLQDPVLLPLYTQQHPHPQPLHLWLRL